jgi:glycosyltransferase involved in cell wall biosynthesis
VHVAFDAFGIKPGSAAIIIENLLQGWAQLDNGDTITVLTEDEPQFQIPEGTRVHKVTAPVDGKLGVAWRRSVGTRRATREIDADGLVCILTATAFLGSSCPRAAVLHDLRHELRKDQFSTQQRAVRWVMFNRTFRSADKLYCITERTRTDLVRSRPWMKEKAELAEYGADHVDDWPVAERAQPPYALAFGQFANKNVNAVLDAWAEFVKTEEKLNLRLVAMGRADREAATQRVASLGIADRVELMPWLDDAQFEACFAGASMVVFPSDFEGFGLPAIEALRLGIPLVVSTDPAVVEVSGGHAVIAEDISPVPLAAAMAEGLRRTPEQIEAGRQHTEKYKWSRMARTIRDGLVESGANP